MESLLFLVTVNRYLSRKLYVYILLIVIADDKGKARGCGT
jgi:hypothetical protein